MKYKTFPSNNITGKVVKPLQSSLPQELLLAVQSYCASIGISSYKLAQKAEACLTPLSTHLLAFWDNLWVRELTWSLADLASSCRLSNWSWITVRFSSSEIKSWFSLSSFCRLMSDSSKFSTLTFIEDRFCDNRSFSWLAFVT